MDPKVIVLGIDGASWSVLNKMISEGYLHNIKKIQKNAIYGDLYSTIPPVTCPAWTSSVTGVYPDKHEIFDFILDFDIKMRYKFANSMKRKKDAIWNILTENQKKSIIVNVPVTYPPEKIHGIIISGMLTPSFESDFTYPKNIKNILVKNNYHIDVGNTMIDKINFYLDDKMIYLDQINEMLKNRYNNCKILLDSFQWDLFMVVFTALDRVQHLYWNYIYNKDDNIYYKVLKIYKKIDDIIGEIMEEYSDTYIIIYSDHGFKECKGHIFPNKIFEINKNLIINKKRNNKINKKFLIKLIHNFQLSNFIDKIPSNIKRIIGNYLPESNIFYSTKDINLMKTTIFTYSNGYVYYKKNKISNIDYYLNNLFKKTPYRNLIQVLNLSKIYNRKYDNKHNIVLTTNNNYLINNMIPKNPIFFLEKNEYSPSLMWDGQHDQKGIFVIYNKNLTSKKINANIVDIAPTILKIFGIKKPNYFDGKSLI